MSFYIEVLKITYGIASPLTDLLLTILQIWVSDAIQIWNNLGIRLNKNKYLDNIKVC
jgi:hypothetical protein